MANSRSPPIPPSVSITHRSAPLPPNVQSTPRHRRCSPHARHPTSTHAYPDAPTCPPTRRAPHPLRPTARPPPAPYHCSAVNPTDLYRRIAALWAAIRAAAAAAWAVAVSIAMPAAVCTVIHCHIRALCSITPLRLQLPRRWRP